MPDAQNAPVKRTYTRREIHSEDTPVSQRADVDLGLESQLVHGDALPDVGDPLKQAYLEALAFNEEPVTILIEENQRSDFPETHVPVAVNGKGAEVFINGGWIEMGWLPIGRNITVKRKYVEQLLRSKSETIRTVHDDATVERPRNLTNRRNSANYPISILEDRSPKGAQWATKIRMEH